MQPYQCRIRPIQEPRRCLVVLHEEIPLPFIDGLSFSNKLCAASSELNAHFLLVVENHFRIEVIPIEFRLKCRPRNPSCAFFTAKPRQPSSSQFIVLGTLLYPIRFPIV